LQAAAEEVYSNPAVNFIWLTDEKVFTLEPPLNGQNDLVYAPVGTKKRHIDTHALNIQQATCLIAGVTVTEGGRAYTETTF